MKNIKNNLNVNHRTRGRMRRTRKQYRRASKHHNNVVRVSIKHDTAYHCWSHKEKSKRWVIVLDPDGNKTIPISKIKHQFYVSPYSNYHTRRVVMVVFNELPSFVKPFVDNS